jgi:hypothetical protein
LWLFQQFGLAGMVSWSIFCTLFFVGSVLWLAVAYKNTEREKHAHGCASFILTFSIGITLAVMFQWVMYHNVHSDISNNIHATKDFITTQPQPFSQIIFTDSVRNKKGAFTTHGNPLNFTYMNRDKIRVRIRYFDLENDKPFLVLCKTE